MADSRCEDSQTHSPELLLEKIRGRAWKRSLACGRAWESWSRACASLLRTSLGTCTSNKLPKNGLAEVVVSTYVVFSLFVSGTLAPGMCFRSIFQYSVWNEAQALASAVLIHSVCFHFLLVIIGNNFFGSSASCTNLVNIRAFLAKHCAFLAKRRHMVSFCCRRRKELQLTNTAAQHPRLPAPSMQSNGLEGSEWSVLSPAHSNTVQARFRFWLAVRLVQRLLKARASWARQGHILSAYAGVTRHLERVHGTLRRRQAICR